MPACPKCRDFRTECDEHDWSKVPCPACGALAGAVCMALGNPDLPLRVAHDARKQAVADV